MNYPSTTGLTNGEYRKARGLDQPFDFNPTAWDAIRGLRQQAERVEIARKIAASKKRAQESEKAKTAKPRKSRRVKERKRIARDGSIRVCSTEPKRRQNRRAPGGNRPAGPQLAETPDLDWEDEL